MEIAVMTKASALKAVSRAIALIAGLLCLTSLALNTLWAPGSWVAHRHWYEVRGLIIKDPARALQHAMLAMAADPREAEYRREAMKPVTNVIVSGLPIDERVVNFAYDVSRHAAGNSPDVMLARLIYLQAAGKVRSPPFNMEADLLLAQIKAVNPLFKEIGMIEAAIKARRAG